ncbi:MAG TPA: hypothetical protein VFK86_10370 [Bauldia sp.]|nr:hypothetical protein [Bauldia sp.]
MDKGVAAAIRRFPERSLEIRRLALADGGFRSLCEDFREAEAALNRWNQSTTDQGALRRSEYRVLVEELAAEIERMIQKPAATGTPPEH